MKKKELHIKSVMGQLETNQKIDRLKEKLEKIKRLNSLKRELIKMVETK